MKKNIAALLSVISLAVFGCASCGLQSKNIVPSADALRHDIQWPALYGNIKVGKIRNLDVGGDNDGYTIESGGLTDRTFRRGVEITLERANLLASDAAAEFRLDVHDSDLSLPLVGSTAEPRWKILYELIDVSSGKVVWRALIDTTSVANMKDSALATIRIRIANERALEMNIREMINELAELKPPKKASSSSAANNHPSRSTNGLNAVG